MSFVLKIFDKILKPFNGFSIEEFLHSTKFLALLLIGISLTLLIQYLKIKKKLKNAEYYLDVIRTVSKSLAKHHEIAAFNENEEIVYTTHPHLYSNKKEFFRNLMGKITTSIAFKNFCNFFDAKKTNSVILTEAGGDSQNQSKKWTASEDFIEADESFTGEEVAVVIVSDISKHFNEIEKIASNYKKLETLLDYFPLGIFYLNNSDKIIGTNLTFANLAGASRERIIDIPITDLIDGFEQNVFSPKPLRVTVKPKFAQKFNAVLIKVPYASNSIHPWVIYKSADAENASTKSDDSFWNQETFIDAYVPSVIINAKGEIQALNPAFATMIQDNIVLDKNKIIKPGSNIVDFIKTNDSNGNILEYLRKPLSSTEKTPPIEIKFAKSDITTLGYISKITPQNSKSGLILIQLIDISSQKVLEQQFIQSQKMQAIGQLAGGIAHDFNNLLTAIIGFCDLLLERYTPKDSSYGDVAQIKQNAGRAAKLVRQLLAFSKQQTLKPKVVSVTELLADISSLLKRLIGTNIDFQLINGRDIWPVKIDNTQFEQVIINLAINARDAMKDGGKLTVRTKNYFTENSFKCIYDVARPGDYVLIEVIDTGCGIKPELIENIFEPFFSRKGENTRKDSGTGLGLSTVYGIVNQTGGFINVESKIGKGSNFKIYIPRYVGSEQIQTIAQPQTARDLSGSETTLLVEDEDAVRMFSARALRDKGYKVLEASCGEEAIELAKNNKFDLLITDVMMPKMDGPTLNKILRGSIKDLKTIFISGYTEDTFRQDIGKNATIHFLQKPFTLKDLLNKVKEALTVS
ncbi:MAG: response regulator [Holosporales bacterium]|nr:response regulator [Holosporales bacterium]